MSETLLSPKRPYTAAEREHLAQLRRIAGLSPHEPVTVPDAAREGASQVLGFDPAVPGSERYTVVLNGPVGEALWQLYADNLRAEGASAERARIRQMALDEADGRAAAYSRECEEILEANGTPGEDTSGASALRDFAALLEEP